MQRKLSEIAEIPKILSSTLATVAQTFDKLMPCDQEPPMQLSGTYNKWQQHAQQRKYSYDEDVLDYELSDVTANAEELVDNSLMQPEQQSKRLKVKDATPESDYASEVNYRGGSEVEADAAEDDSSMAYEHDDAVDSGDNEDTTEDGDIHEDYDDEDENIDYEKDTHCSYSARAQANDIANYMWKRQKRTSDTANRRCQYTVNEDNTITDSSDNDNDEHELQDDDNYAVAIGNEDNDDDDGDDDDFLNATYTWNVRNIPKLQLNDEKSDATAMLHIDNVNAANKTASDTNNGGVERETGKPKDMLKRGDAAAVEGVREVEPEASQGEKDLKFVDKLERAWPWADREKIIYKQSTCHLVRRKPLGLVEQRKQLLEKQNLADTLQRMERQQKVDDK